MTQSNRDRDWLVRAPESRKMERIEAYFSGHGYTTHRHDTYAIGVTLCGVQSFNYRHSKRHSQPGGTIVLHPDEIHDGEAGTSDGFRYRMFYVEPSVIQQVLGGKPLPFIEGGCRTILTSMWLPVDYCAAWIIHSIRWKRRTASTMWPRHWTAQRVTGVVGD